MPIKMFSQKELDQLRTDLIECKSLEQDITNAKKAGIAGIEILEERYKDCLGKLQSLHDVYGKK